MRRTRKAVSPVIATLLLILIAVAAAIIVYVWVTGYASSITSQGAPEVQERIKIEAVSYDPANKDVIVYIRNIGDTSALVKDVYLIRADTNTVLFAGEQASGSEKEISPGEVLVCLMDLDGNAFKYMKAGEDSYTDGSVITDNIDQLSEGVTYIIKAVTKSGVEAATSFSYEY